MGYFDNYEPYTPSYGRGIGALYQALQDRRERERQEKLDADEGEDRRLRRAEYRRQNDLSERRLSMQDKRDQRKEQMDLTARNQKLAKDVLDLAAEGRESEADVLARSSEYVDVDPETGETRRRSLGFERSRPGGDELTPGELQQPTAFEPKEYSGFASMMKPMQSDLFETGAQPQRRDFAGFLQSQLSPQKQLLGPAPVSITNIQQQAQRGPAVVLPGGERVEIDPQERARRQEQLARERQERFAALAEKESDPAIRRALLLRAGITGAQATAPEAQQIMAADTREDTQAHQSTQLDKTLQNRTEVAKLRKKSGGGTPKPEGATIKEGYYVNSKVNAILRNFNFKGTNDEFHKFGRIANVLAMKNPAADAMAAGTFVKIAQGGSGVISDKDMNQFWNNVGGVPDRIDTWIQGVIDGTIPHPKRQYVIDTVQRMAQQAAPRMNQMSGAMREAIISDPTIQATGRGEQWADNATGAYFGKQTQAKKPEPGQVIRINSGPYKGRRAQALPNGKFKLLD